MDYAKRAEERDRLDMSDAGTRATALDLARAAKGTEGWGQMPDGWAPPICADKGPLWVVFTENDHPDGSAIVAITGNGPTSEANARFFVDAKRVVLALLEERDRLATCLRNTAARHEAELQAAHAAGVAEGRARWAPVALAARSALGKYAYDTGYGFFIGGDPRRFSPDEESSTSEEIAAWKAACAEAEADEKARDLPSPCGLETVEHEGRKVPAFVDRAPFGLGTYECGDEEAEAACKAITALLGDGLIGGAAAAKAQPGAVDVAALGEAEDGR